jgi:hypothetical protein
VADRAILKTLEAAFDFQLANLRYRSLKAMEARSHAALDHLIRDLRALSEAIARLPATSKGQLNKRVFAKIDQAPFDSEAFIDVIETTGSFPRLVRADRKLQTGNRRLHYLVRGPGSVGRKRQSASACSRNGALAAPSHSSRGDCRV